MKSDIDIEYSQHPTPCAVVTETRGGKCVRVAISADAFYPRLKALARTPRQPPGRAGAVLWALDTMTGERNVTQDEIDAAILDMATPMLEDVWRRA